MSLFPRTDAAVWLALLAVGAVVGVQSARWVRDRQYVGDRAETHVSHGSEAYCKRQQKLLDEIKAELELARQQVRLLPDRSDEFTDPWRLLESRDPFFNQLTNRSSILLSRSSSKSLSYRRKQDRRELVRLRARVLRYRQDARKLKTWRFPRNR